MAVLGAPFEERGGEGIRIVGDRSTAADRSPERGAVLVFQAEGCALTLGPHFMQLRPVSVGLQLAAADHGQLHESFDRLRAED